jgi:hypothetical protein
VNLKSWLGCSWTFGHWNGSWATSSSKSTAHALSASGQQQLFLLVDERCGAFAVMFKNFDEKQAFHKADFSIVLSPMFKDLGPYTERIDLWFEAFFVKEIMCNWMVARD